jgi:hypothetical protein
MFSVELDYLSGDGARLFMNLLRGFCMLCMPSVGMLCAIFAEFFEKMAKNLQKILDMTVFIWY